MPTKKWSKHEDELLLHLREKNMPYKKLPRFFEGRSQDSIRNRTWVLKNQASRDWMSEEVVAAFDIETTDLKANVGFCLSWYMVMTNGKEVGACITRKEIMNGTTDLRVIKEFLKVLKEVDVLVGYYSTGFDIPFMRTRAEIHGLDFPSFGTVKHFDLYYLIRNKFSLTRKSLGVACEALGLDKKGHVPVADWNKARIGNAAAIAEIYKYNKQDVFITMELFDRVKKYRKITRKSI